MNSGNMRNTHTEPPSSRNRLNSSRNHRGEERMRDYNMQKARQSDDHWTDEMHVDQRYDDIVASRSKISTHRANMYNKRQAAKASRTPRTEGPENRPVRSEQRAITETPPVDEDLWTAGPYAGTHPTVQEYSSNIDCSTFPLVIEAAYLAMEGADPRIRRQMPFCMFQHAMNEVLQVYLIEIAKFENCDREFMDESSPIGILPEGMMIPEAVAEYIRSLAPATNAAGDKIKLNFPAAARPLPMTNILEAGSFGVCDANSHNAYECYMAPIVTMRLIEATVAQNAHGAAIGDWDPLPAALVPANTTPTPNLLGYRIPERLNQEGVNKIANLLFTNDATIAGRIRDCPQLMHSVSLTLTGLRDKLKMTDVFPKPKTNSGSLGFICVTGDSESTTCLASINGEVRSPIALGATGSNRCGLFGMRRQRTETAPGYCFIAAANAAPQGWQATRNYNFEMRGRFAALVGSDRASLRENLNTDPSPNGSRINSICEFFTRAYRIVRRQ